MPTYAYSSSIHQVGREIGQWSPSSTALQQTHLLVTTYRRYPTTCVPSSKDGQEQHFHCNTKVHVQIPKSIRPNTNQPAKYACMHAYIHIFMCLQCLFIIVYLTSYLTSKYQVLTKSYHTIYLDFVFLFSSSFFLFCSSPLSFDQIRWTIETPSSINATRKEGGKEKRKWKKNLVRYAGRHSSLSLALAPFRSSYISKQVSRYLM